MNLNAGGKPMDKDKITFLLSQLIQHRSNDLLMNLQDGDVTEADGEHFTELIMGITRYLHDIRYCSRSSCACSPEREIEHHYEYIKEYLLKTMGALYPIPWKTIEEILGRTN